MKKVLIITYYWPPSGGSGVQRWMYFAKYLSQFGYEPVVLTVDAKYASYKNIDQSLLDFVGEIRTIRTKSIEPLKLYSWLTTGNTKSGLPQGAIVPKTKSLFHRIANYLRSDVFIPDARVGWNFFALAAARKLLNSEVFDFIITTGPPHSTHLIGLKLRSEFPIKWLADFRDPWSEVFYNQHLSRSKKSTEKDLALECAVLNKADIVLTVGVKLKELLLQKINARSTKFYSIYNGFDAEKINTLPVDSNEVFEITFIGLLTSNQPYSAFIEAVKSFLAINQNAEVKLILAGTVDPQILTVMRSEIPRTQIDYLGYLAHDNAIALMMKSQLLVNILAEMKHSDILISGKQMEYIASGNPILSIGSKSSESAIILQDIGHARVYEKDETQFMALFINEIYQKWTNGISIRGVTDTPQIQSKSRFETTRQLSQLLDANH